MIAISYIDKRSATILALKDYHLMKKTIAITPEEIKKKCAQNNEIAVGHSKPYDPGPNDSLSALDPLQFQEEQYLRAVEYMNWLMPSWQQLSENQQIVLKELYMAEKQRTGALVRLQHKLNYSERQVGRLRDKAVSDLSFLLYGK